jgi:serine protease Do
MIHAKNLGAAMLAAAVTLGMSGLAAGQSSAPSPSREAARMSFAPIVKKAAPAVVNVYSRHVVHAQSPFLNDPFFRRLFGNDLLRLAIPRDRIAQSLGSGVILRSDGLIVTNHHVIKDADQITVVLGDRREFEAKVLLSDERIDLAVLKIDVKNEKLPVLELGDSDQLQVGDQVLAIGDPFGVGQTVTSGIVSGLARTGIGLNDFGSYIQTDAAINPGNSGGALIDLDGKLIGINTAIYSESGGSLGIGFAIPTALVHTVLEAATHGGKIVRPWLGISAEDVTNERAGKLGLPRPGGVEVKDVAPDGPAAKAGIKNGDVILGIDGHETDDDESLSFRLATLSVNTPAKLTLFRGGATETVTAMLIAPLDQPARAVTPLTGAFPLSGATVGNLNPAFVDELGLKQGSTGVVVVQVQPNTPAARLGLKSGDVILSLNRRKIDSVDTLRDTLAQNSASWVLSLRRGKQTLNATVR